MDLNSGAELFFLLFLVPYCVFGRFGVKDDYETWHKTLTPFQAHACDDEELNLRCTVNTVISIHYVMYGRPESSESVCPGRSRTYAPIGRTASCISSKALQVIRDRCHKNMVCRLHIAPETFRDDPCPGVRKFVEVVYKCRPEQFANKIICEGNYLHLACAAGQVLTIYSASYGTTKSGVDECRQQNDGALEDCLIDHADETVRSICSGKPNCTLKAEDRTFGNPGCKGNKYLKVAYNCLETELVLSSGRRTAEDGIQTTSFPAWARGIDQSAQNNFWPQGPELPTPTQASATSKLEMQSDEVKSDHKKQSLSGDQKLVGFMSKWMSAHKYVSGNKDKLILYVSVSLGVGLIVLVTVLGGRLVIMRLDSRRNSKGDDVTPETEDQFFSDSDLEQYDPSPESLPPPVAIITTSVKRHDSDALPRAPVNTGSELNHYFS